MKKILITGASGFIGSFLVEEALNKGYEVYAGVRSTSNRQFLNDPRLHFFELDFSNKNNLEERLTAFTKSNGKLDFIIHGAGITRARHKPDFTKVNFINTKNFIESLQNSDCKPEKFIFLSTLATYGPGDPVSMKPIKSNDTKRPLSLYGKSKLMAEEFIIAQNNFPYVIIQPTAVYGPRDKDFLSYFKMMKTGLEPDISPKKQHLSLIYVKDLTKIIIRILESPSINKSYIISDGESYQNKDLSFHIKKTLNKRTIAFHVPTLLMKNGVYIIENICRLGGRFPFLNSGKINEMTSLNWLCDISSIRDELQFSPSYDLEHGIKETVNWYVSNNWL